MPSIADIIVVLLIITGVAFAVRGIVKSKKSGSCCGCSGCSSGSSCHCTATDQNNK